MPSSDFNNSQKSPLLRPTSITPIPPPSHPVVVAAAAAAGHRHPNAGSRTSLPIPIAHSLPTNGHSRQLSDSSVVRNNSLEKEWSRSIPEAGYITLGTLRYGVRLSSASSRLSDGLSCRNSDSIDTCSVLLPSQQQQQQQHVTLPREGRQRLKAESPTCGNCCCGVVALATNGRCCDGSLCFSSGSSVAPQPRNSVQEQQQRRRTRHDSAVTRLPFPKNRTSTLSPSHQQQQQTSTRTTSWCSSSSSAVSTAVVSPISSRSASSEAHPSALLRVHHPVSEFSLSCNGSNNNNKNSNNRTRCCQVNYREGRLKPPVPRSSVTRTISKYETSNREQPQRQPRRRSLSTEEEIRSIGCFNLRQSQPVNNNNKAKVGQLSNKAAVGVAAEDHHQSQKPSWLQICDPCHRILERSLTPDIVLVQRINRDAGRCMRNDEQQVKQQTSVDLESADLRFIDSSAGDLHNWQDANGNNNNNNHKNSRRRLSNKECPPVNSRLSASAADDDVDQVGGTGCRRRSETRIVNNNNSSRDWEYFCSRENSLNSNNNHSKLFGRSREPNPPPPSLKSTSLLRQSQRPEDPVDVEDDGVRAEAVEDGADDDDDVANNNLGEKERQWRRRIASELSSSRNCVSAAAVASDRGRSGCRLSPEVERRQATQSPQQNFTKSQNGCGSKEDFKNCLEGGAGDTLSSACQRDSFEEDYERCIESINRQLKLESRDVSHQQQPRICEAEDLIGLSKADCQPVANSSSTTAEDQQRKGEKEEPTMEKRRNTFERFQRWGFGQRSASNNDLAAASAAAAAGGEPKKKDKSERLKDLTELLKGTRIPSLSSFNRNTLRESSCSPPPVPPPRRQRCGFSVEKSFEKLESIEDNEGSDSGSKAVERKISVPSMKINDGNSSTSSPGQTRAAKPLHLSISSPHFRLLLEKSQPSPQPPHTTDCNDIPVHAEELFSLPRVEPKTIIGSYAQKNIPYRSASFSQVDYNSGKYSLGSADREAAAAAAKHLKENRNSASVLDSSTYPRRRGDLRLLRNMKLGSPGPKGQQEQDRSIAEESSSPSPEHEDRRMSVLETIESYDVEESVSEDVPPRIVQVVEVKEEEEVGDGEVNDQKVDLKKDDDLVDQVPTLLPSDDVPSDKSDESSNGDQKIYQTACEIPTPVFECCGKEGETVTEWFQLKESEDVPAVAAEATVCKDCPEVSVTPSAIERSPTLSASPDPCRVEVRKRNTFSSDSGNSKQSSLEKNDEPSEERRKIDKSKRRKGIYIQWPVATTGKVPGDSSWDIDSPECEIVPPGGGPLKLNVNLGLNFDCLSTASCEPLTPDSDNFVPNPHWPKKGSSKDGAAVRNKKGLTYQSSDEKDDAKDGQKRVTLLRMDSTSDNESDRAPSRSRDLRESVSPSRDDLKRYSKRPLRGPYGQMLEAEMKKATKVHYDEILDDLRSSSELKTSPRVGRSNVSHSLDESAKNANAKEKSPKPRKTSAHLPIPFHERAASTPSQMDHQADEVDLTVVHKKFPNSVEKLYYDAVPPSPVQQKLPDLGRLQKSVFHSEVMLAVATSPPATPSAPAPNKPCKRTASAFMDRSSRKRAEKAINSPDRKHNSELVVETPRGPMASNDLLAELLKGSSEKHHQQSLAVGRRGPATASPTKTLPQAVLKCLDTRTHVVIELFNTEQSYVDSLHTVIMKYLNPLKSSDHLRDIVDSQLVDEIFYMVPSILGIHERFLEELHKRLGAWDCNQRVGDAFIDVFSSSSVVEIYTCFVNNWNKAKNAIRQASAAKPAFARFLETMAREHKGKLSLDNLLIKPVQKFPNYELILSRLIKHTDSDHPDQSLLQEANRLVHNILMHLNCKEREALENGQREATLRELEVVIEGITDLVSPDRTFLLFDLVSMFSGQTTRKERGLFLFSDVLVIASVKKRTGTIKRPTTSFASAVAATLDMNKYKFLTKMPLTDLEIAKAKDESVRKMMREIEYLSEDNAKIQKIIDMMNSIRFPHQGLEESMKDLQKDVQKQLTERQANDTQLSILEFTLVSSQNMSILFSQPEKRNQWEEAFSAAKQKLATSYEKNVAPEFLSMIPIRKTRAGLQFTCAASTIGPMNDVWVCNSDGYVGQVCVLSLYPEPTVTSCNGVCNARILCVTSVPPASYSEAASRESTASGSGEPQFPVNDNEDRGVLPTTTTSGTDNGLQLDSSSSSDNESDIEFSPQLNASVQQSHLELQRDNLKEQSPALSVPQTMTTVSSTASLAKSDVEDMDRMQSTMWLGTEDGCVHVYNCTDNIRIKKNKIKIQHSSAVYSILYLDNRVFVSLANGDICVYLRDNAGWNTNSPITISVGAITSPVTKLLNVHGKIWCAIQGTIKVLNVQQLQIESQIQISTESKPITNMVASSTNCVWLAIQNSSIIKCYHSTGHELLFEIDVSSPVNKMLSSCDDIIRQHKSACLRITSLQACKDLLWIGTSAGVLLNLPVSNSTKGLQHIVSSLTGISYGHTGHVRFLTSVELNSPGSAAAANSTGLNKASGVNLNVNNNNNKALPTTLIISGGDGYEDFRSSSANSANEVAGREDSTNHLLLWQI